MKFFVDYRESVIFPLLDKYGVPYEVRNLEVADYIIDGIGIERKTITDYLNSLMTGRLNNQLYNLSYNFDLSYLCVVGYISEGLIYSKISRKAYISSLVGSSLKRANDGKMGQVVTVNLETDYDFVFFLKALHKKLSEGDTVRLPIRRVKKKVVTDYELAKTVIMAFPGVSEIRAEKILKKFGSIKKFINASLEDLKSVEGIGKVTAQKIFELINKNFGGD